MSLLLYELHFLFSRAPHSNDIKFLRMLYQ